MEALLANSVQGLAALVLCSIRFFILSFFLPYLRKQALVGLIQVVVVLALGSMIVPTVWGDLPRPMAITFWLPIVIKEVFIGLILGFIAGAPFWVLDALGIMIDQQTGSTQSSVMDPLSGHPTGPSSFFLTYSISGLLLAGGFFVALVGAVYDSYVVWPVLASLPELPTDFSELFAAQYARQFALWAVLALPFMIVLVFIEVVVGFFGKALSALDGHAFAQGLKQLSAQAILMLMLAIILARVLEYLAGFPLLQTARELLGG